MSADAQLIAALQSKRAIVYWLKDESCRDPLTDGYVGVTGKPGRVRLWQHRRFGRFPSASFDLIELWRGNRIECLRREALWRPKPNIGWNTKAGGGPKVQ